MSSMTRLDDALLGLADGHFPRGLPKEVTPWMIQHRLTAKANLADTCRAIAEHFRCRHTYGDSGARCARWIGHEGPCLYRCAGHRCPGLPQPASVCVHPSSCTGE